MQEKGLNGERKRRVEVMKKKDRGLGRAHAVYIQRENMWSCPKNNFLFFKNKVYIMYIFLINVIIFFGYI